MTVTWWNDFFLNFNMSDKRHIENFILAITQQPIARFQWNFAWGSSFTQNFGNGTVRRHVPQNVFYYPTAVWATASGGFGIISDTLVCSTSHSRRSGAYGSHSFTCQLHRTCLYLASVHHVHGACTLFALSINRKSFCCISTIVLHHISWRAICLYFHSNSVRHVPVLYRHGLTHHYTFISFISAQCRHFRPKKCRPKII